MTRLEQQLAFLLEADRLKHVARRTRLLTPGDGASRFENSAEHSWHIALMALVLAEHSNEPVDVSRVIRMLLLHDLVEIDAGDTPAFGAQGDKEILEARAAERIFGMLPPDQREMCLELWEEFECSETPEARFANAIDRVMPSFQNIRNRGGSWIDFNVDRTRADARLTPIAEGSETLWNVVRGILDEAEAKGYLKGNES